MDGYKIKDFRIQQLYVNPDNARFINANELPDEIAAIRELAMMPKSHILTLARDISLHGLNPNELPIIVPGPENDGRFLVIEGNRRISCIKLMTQYHKDLDKIGLSLGQIRVLSKLQCDIETVSCVLYDDEDKVNELLEKIHTSKPGIGRVNWDPQAQDRHQYKVGTLSRRLAVIELLRYSQFTDPRVKNIIKKQGWLSKLLRFVRIDSYMMTFGIRFDENNNILLLFEEEEVVKSLGQLVIDLNQTAASKIAQTEDVRGAYINNFPEDKRPNLKKKTDMLILFNVKTKIFEDTQLPNNFVSEVSQNEQEEDASNEDNKTSNDGMDKSKDSTGTEDNAQNHNDTDENNKNPNNNMQSTDDRTTLIPKDCSIGMKNQRTLDLFNELKLINVGKYTNCVSTSLRSLIEFSINCFLDSKSSNLAFNEKVTLFEKLEKVIRILESRYPKSLLETKIPAIYRSIDAYNSTGKKSDLNSIPNLHILIHSHNYHPIDKELKAIYNNYEPLLKYIWENI